MSKRFTIQKFLRYITYKILNYLNIENNLMKNYKKKCYNLLYT